MNKNKITSLILASTMLSQTLPVTNAQEISITDLTSVSETNTTESEKIDTNINTNENNTYSIEESILEESKNTNSDTISFTEDTIKEKYEDIEEIYIENRDDGEYYEKELKNNIDSEYWIVSNEPLEKDFIKKAILHYKYLNKHYAICKGEDKFTLGIEKEYEGKVIPRERLDYLDMSEDIEVDTYYIWIMLTIIT